MALHITGEELARRLVPLEQLSVARWDAVRRGPSAPQPRPRALDRGSGGIVRAAEAAAHLSSRMVEFPRRNAERTAEMQAVLSEVDAAAAASASEAKVVASAAVEQLKAIEDLSQSALDPSLSAERMGVATRFVKGQGWHCGVAKPQPRRQDCRDPSGHRGPQSKD